MSSRYDQFLLFAPATCFLFLYVTSFHARVKSESKEKLDFQMILDPISTPLLYWTRVYYHLANRLFLGRFFKCSLSGQVYFKA